MHGTEFVDLAISEELTFLMGGTIGIRSLPGQGATFWIILPVRIQSGQMDVRARMVLT